MLSVVEFNEASPFLLPTRGLLRGRDAHEDDEELSGCIFSACCIEVSIGREERAALNCNIIASSFLHFSSTPIDTKQGLLRLCAGCNDNGGTLGTVFSPTATFSKAALLPLLRTLDEDGIQGAIFLSASNADTVAPNEVGRCMAPNEAALLSSHNDDADDVEEVRILRIGTTFSSTSKDSKAALLLLCFSDDNAGFHWAALSCTPNTNLSSSPSASNLAVMARALAISSFNERAAIEIVTSLSASSTSLHRTTSNSFKPCVSLGDNGAMVHWLDC
jgi:hypothetical protein